MESLNKKVLEKKHLYFFLCLQTSTHFFKNKHDMFLLDQAWGEKMPGPRTGRTGKHAGLFRAGEIHLLGFLEDVLKLGSPPNKKETEFERYTSWEFLSKHFKTPVKKILTVKNDQACYCKKTSKYLFFLKSNSPSSEP